MRAKQLELLGDGRGEDALQIAIVGFLEQFAYDDVIWYHVPNQGRRSIGYAMKMRRMGLRPGIADLCFVCPDGRPAFMELKHGAGAVRPDQMTFARKCVRLGIRHEFVRSIDQAMTVLRDWGIAPIADHPRRSTGETNA